MISKELEIEILRLYHAEKWLVGTISHELGVHHSAVRRVLAQEGTIRAVPTRTRLTDPYVPFISQMLDQYEDLTAKRLYEMARERGYAGKGSQFRAVVAELRPRKHEAFLRLKTLPGEQAQVDWGHFGRLTCGSAQRPLMAFVIVLSHSRAIFLRFFLSQSLGNFLRGHELAFNWFGGVSRICLYDNLKSVVLERIGLAIRFNPQFLNFAGHYRFQPRPVAVARGNEKGRTERAIRYIRSNFFAARRFRDLEDLNAQALKWCEGAALERCWQDDPMRRVGDVFEEEKKLLLALPDNPFPCEERQEVSIGKTPYARFDLNDYSLPHTLVRNTVVVLASPETVRILHGNEVVATHPRSFDRGRQIEDPLHHQELRREKTEAGQHRRTNSLTQAVPSVTKLLLHVAERGLPLGQATSQLMTLLQSYGATALEEAIGEALTNNTLHLHAVRHILERARQQAGKSPALPLTLPDDPRVKNLVITPHSLGAYDTISEESNETDDDKNN